MKTLIAKVTIPLYVRQIRTSENRKPTYYEKGKKNPPKDVQSSIYGWMLFRLPKAGKLKSVHLWANLKTKKPVLANPNLVGTAKMKNINSQDLHTLTMKTYERAAVVKTIKEQFKPFIAELEPITTLPIIIYAELFDTFEDDLANNANWDVDNRFGFYAKVFQDVLTGCIVRAKGKKAIATSKIIIPDDNRRYITGSSGCLFTPVDNPSERKIVFSIYHDQRPCIVNCKHYQK